MTDTNSSGGCAACTVLGRRDFLRDAAFAFAAIAASGATAGAMPVHRVNALGVHDEFVTFALPAADGVFIDRKNEVIVARAANQVYAFTLSCPHQNTALRWNASEHKFQCPKHHSQYTPDGTFIDGRATRSMDRFAVQRQGDNLVVNLDKIFESDKDPNGWKAAEIAL
jgi:nitrite reductase/ring-hydroxylating ferredoxin subunit